MSAPFLKIGDDLRLKIGDAEARLTPAQGLRAAERLARASFKAALREEAGKEMQRDHRAPRAAVRTSR